MTRKDPDTLYFHYDNINPKNRKTGDCVIRAISRAIGESWEYTLKELTSMSLRYCYSPLSVENFHRVLENYGFVKNKQMRKFDNTKYTGEEFVEYLTNHREIMHGYPVVANVGGHHTSVFVDEGDRVRCYDIWDCTDRTVGNFWTKED